MTFETRVLDRIRRRPALRNIRAPKGNGTEWRVEDPATGPVTIIAKVRASALTGNIQTDLGAIPMFLVAFAFWYEHEVRCKLVCDEEPVGSVLHWNRSLFVIDQLQRVLGGRFTAELPSPWCWPDSPLMNAELSDRDALGSTPGGRERVFEQSMRQSQSARSAFSEELEPIDAFRRQLPVGLFAGTLSKTQRWFPGGNSQVDLWAPSTDAKTVHLFELKATDTPKLGALAQAFFYARLLHHVRVGLACGAQIIGSGSGVDAIRRADNLRMWLAAEKLHPLVLSGNRSPLEWLNLGMGGEGVALGVIPVELDNAGQFARWCFNERWPRR